jgi:RNA polymerase sigma-32 factor
MPRRRRPPEAPAGARPSAPREGAPGAARPAAARPAAAPPAAAPPAATPPLATPPLAVADAEPLEPDLDEAEPDPAELTEETPDPIDVAALPAGGGEETPAGFEDERAAVAEAPGSSLVRHDPLSAYIREIRQYPLLSREEEHALAVRFVRTGDVVAARRLITANLRLVVKIAHEYQRAYRNLLDLVQEGNIGLMQAVKKYDPYRGVKFSSYSAWWIRAYVLKFILNNWRLVKIGTTQAQRKLFFNLRKEKERIEAMGYEAGPKLLAERLDVSEQDVREMEQRLGSAEVSLDAPLTRDEGGGRTFLDLVPGSDKARPDAQVEGREFSDLLRQKLEAFAQTLHGREQTIFHDRLLADPPLTLQEIGERYGISRERARQLEKRLLDRLRGYLQSELGDTVDVMLGREE